MGLSRDADVLRSSECGDSEKAGGEGRGPKTNPNQTKHHRGIGIHTRIPRDPSSCIYLCLAWSTISGEHEQQQTAEAGYGRC